MIKTPAKIAIAGGALVVGVGGGFGIWGLTAKSSSPIAPILTPPQNITVGDNNDTDYSGKFGEDFKYHLVSTKTQSNSDWWNWVFQHVWGKDNDKDTEFQDINDGSSLNAKCEAAYKKDTKTEIWSSRSSYEKSVWRYCSVGNKKPLTVVEVSEESTNSSGLGQDEGNKLVAITSKENDWFWEIQEKAFFKQGEKAGIGSKATSGTAFQTLYDKKDKRVEDTLRNACQNSYEQKTYVNEEIVDSSGRSEPTPTTQDALMFCSLQAAKN